MVNRHLVQSNLPPLNSSALHAAWSFAGGICFICRPVRLGQIPISKYGTFVQGIRMQQELQRRIVVTGVGVVSPLAVDVDTFWSRLTAGESGIHQLTTLDTTNYKVHFGGDIPDFNVTDWVDRREVKRLDRFTQFAVHAGGQAIKDSALDFDQSWIGQVWRHSGFGHWWSWRD